jgi:hypothetical protein
VTFDLDITLFGMSFIKKIKMKGETGKKNDRFSILINTPVTFFKDDIASLLRQIIKID